MTSDRLSFASVEIDKNYSLTLPHGKVCVTGGHVISRSQGLSSNDQRRQRRENLGTRLEQIFSHTPLHSTAVPAVRAAIKTESSFRNDTIIASFLVVNKNIDDAKIALDFSNTLEFWV